RSVRADPAKARQDLDSVHSWKHDIEQNEVDLALTQELERRRAIRRFQNDVIRLQEAPQQVTNHGLVVHDQDHLTPPALKHRRRRHDGAARRCCWSARFAAAFRTDSPDAYCTHYQITYRESLRAPSRLKNGRRGSEGRQWTPHTK